MSAPTPGERRLPPSAARARPGDGRYRSVFEATAIGIALVDVRGGVVETNPALERMLGYSAEELQGMPVREFTHPENAESDLGLFRDLLEGLREGFQFETRYRRRDGSALWAYVTVTRFEDAEQPLALAMVEDITERRVAEEALVESQRQLLQSQKMEAVGRLAGAIAHDFNNMLTAIKGFSSLLQMDLDAENPLLAYVQEIDKAADRSASLTRQLLTFSRRQVTQPRILDLNGVVREMEGMLRRLIGADVHFSLLLAPEGTRVRADPVQMEQVVLNLVVNARDAMPAGGTLEVVTRSHALPSPSDAAETSAARDEFAQLSVRDTGSGISAEVRERIFDPFFTTKEEGKGTGLGLSTVYGIVKQSGGRIEIDSEMGEGTTFHILLPRVEGEVEGTAAQRPASPRSSGAETVLLAEDEPVVRELARRILLRAGYNVLTSESGEHALEVAGGYDQPIHLLLTDVVMPQISGPELARRLRVLRPGVRVLYISGYSMDMLSQRSLPELDARLLQKPFSLESLTRAVQDVLSAPGSG